MARRISLLFMLAAQGLAPATAQMRSLTQVGCAAGAVSLPSPSVGTISSQGGGSSVPCVWTLGSLGASTKLFNLLFAGDQRGSDLTIFGAPGWTTYPS